jgi:hypothetical protein
VSGEPEVLQGTAAIAANGRVDRGVVRLPERQKEILSHIGATCDAGMIWLATGCYGAGDAAAIKALWKKGLAEKYRRSDGNDSGYWSVITQAGRNWLLTHNTERSGPP